MATPKPRKTLEVASIVRRFNRAIMGAKPHERPALCSVLESLLMDANAYGGFLYTGGYRPEDPDFDHYNREYLFRSVG